jgi:hypothetical protein
MAVAVQTPVDVQDAVLSHLLVMLKGTAVYDEPFTHCYFEDVFPASIYAEILAALPETSLYVAGRVKAEEGYSTRQRFPLQASHLKGLPEPQRRLWTGISSALCSKEFQSKLFDKLSVGLAQRFGIRPDQAAQVAAYPRPALFRDLPGYEIAPHPDTRRKIVTVQLFLPPDDSRPYLGTSLYRTRMNPLKSLFSSQGRFECFKQFPFRANTGYAFVVSNSPLRPKSWHGCEKTPPDAGERDTLLHIYYDEPKEE